MPVVFCCSRSPQTPAYEKERTLIHELMLLLQLQLLLLPLLFKVIIVCLLAAAAACSQSLSAPDDEDALPNLARPVTQRVLPLELHRRSTCRQTN
jgi:hypothetical protein